MPRLPKTAFRVDGRGRQFPPLGLLRSLAKVRRRSAPVDRSFQDWAADQVGDDHACALSSFMGVATFDHDPGRFSARFVQERLVRATAPIPTVRYIPGGWGTLSGRLGSHARSLGVRIELGATVDAVPDGPTILALPIERAAELLDDASLVPSGTRTALLDLGLEGKAPPLLAPDFDEPGWIETYSLPDPDARATRPSPRPGTEGSAPRRVPGRRDRPDRSPARRDLPRVASPGGLAAAGAESSTRPARSTYPV